MKNASPKLQYFIFCPSDWMNVFFMTDEEAGKTFKTFIGRLTSNEAPEGTQEYDMIQKVKDYRAKQREKIMKRWHPETLQTEQKPTPQPQIPRKLPRPQVAKVQPPELYEVYDFCSENFFPEPYGREWYEWQEQKGWNTLKKPWKIALRGFCQKKMNQ